MKTRILALLCSGTALTAGYGQTLLFSDNFDTADTNNFDGAPTAGRLTGPLASDVVLRAWGAQQDISSNQLSTRTGGGTRGGVRFENAPGGGATNRYDWIGGAQGTTILNEGGLIVEFDWTPADNTSETWVSYNFGLDNSDPPGGSFWVNNAVTDYGILFRNNGGVQAFDNGTNVADLPADTFTTTAGGATTYQVKITYAFSSNADNDTFDVVATVDGTLVHTGTYDFDGNAGVLIHELGNNNAGNLVDNMTVSTLGISPAYGIALDSTSFVSGDPQGTAIGTLSAFIGATPEVSTYTFVMGEGDTDNAKFQITGDVLEVGSFDFTGANSTEGQVFSVRIKGTSDTDPLETEEKTYALTITKDDDLDDLPDDWELQWAVDLSILSGLSMADADGDTLTDLEELQLNMGTFPGYPAYPLLDPTNANTDGDGVLSDGEELFPVSSRPPTDPTNPDTDDDGLTDVAETNTLSWTDASDTGTDPTNPDHDDDGSRDGWELANVDGPAMHDPAVFPPSVSPSVTVTQLTDDASSLISGQKVYTHKVSGGTTATVNGVSFDLLDELTTPADFDWTPEGGMKNQIPFNNGDWIPGDGGVTGPGLLELLGGFSYSNSEANPGGLQTYTLSGLTPGEDYILRLYVRIWDTEGAGRKIDLTFTNGAEVVVPYGALPEDRPGIVLGTANPHDAYFLTYTYNAQGTDLVIEAGTFHVGPVPSGSFHLYGLSNEIEGAVVAPPIVITDVSRNLAGDFIIDFTAAVSATYNVTKSADLVGDFDPFDPPLSVMTDGVGVGQATIPASAITGPAEYYRIETP